jgi:hypothetical protein
MSRSLRILTALLLSLAPSAAWAANADSQELPAVIVSTDREFIIPFEIERPDSDSELPATVELLVSEDYGNTWTKSQTAKSDQDSFVYRAAHEGEFWFRTQSLDAAGNVSQPAPGQPELRVLVKSPLPQQHVTAGFPVDRLPRGVRPLMVNSCAFEVDYDVGALAPAEIAKVELWWTGDGGRSWNRYGVDDDCASPAKVRVEKDGLYGFWIVVESSGGMRGADPHAGDLPQFWVGVDTTPPVAKLIGAETGLGEPGEPFSIRWEASDALLADKPISLAYAPDATGPWTTIASGITNQGLYTFTLPGRLGERTYLRLTARDAAGNDVVVESKTAIAVARNLPANLGAAGGGTRWYHALR